MINQRKKRKPLTGIVILIALVGFIIFAIFSFWQFLKSPLDPNGKTQAFVVQKGESASIVAERLEKAGIIRSSLAFKISYKSNNSKIEAGTFKLSSAMSLEEVMQNLSRGSVDKWVTLIEGWRIEEIAEELNSKIKIQKSKFIEDAKEFEGFLFPDTYLFNAESTPETIIASMRGNFDKKYTEELQQKIQAKGLTPQQGVILASIVEREGRSDKVRTEVASILLKRFKMGMKLDADATVQYAKDSQKFKNGNLDKFWQPITKADYSAVISPFNTYLNNGLPPTPICNPSLSSLKAVANANPNTPYLFYYHDPKGNSYYAKTIEEHNQNVANHP